MTVWLDRAGSHGEQEDFALEKGIAVIGWWELSDLNRCKTKENLLELLKQTFPDAKSNTIYNWCGQIWAFLGRWKKGDLVVLPLKTRSAIAIGRVESDYLYEPNNPEGARHTRRLKWIKTDIPRTAFDKDLLYSFGAAMTVCQIKRNNAEERILAVLEGKPPLPPPPPTEAEGEDPEPAFDLDEYARDQIRSFITQKFKGHDLERLVNEILKAQGYRTQSVPPGADRGVDIIAGRGPLGFDAPRLVIQVKSSDSPIDVTVLRGLQGILKNFRADQGLLVSWGGFTSAVDKEARQIFFEIRLWDSDDLITALLENYDNLSEDLQAELPLKRIWTLVQEE